MFSITDCIADSRYQLLDRATRTAAAAAAGRVNLLQAGECVDGKLFR